jgi:hypothetical protein
MVGIGAICVYMELSEMWMPYKGGPTDAFPEMSQRLNNKGLEFNSCHVVER